MERPLRNYAYAVPVGMPQGIIKPTSIDKAWIAADPAAALVGSLSTILAVFGVWTWLNLDADQVAILGGAALGVMGSWRTLRERKQRKAVLELHEEHERLKRETGSPADGEVPVSDAPGGSESSQEESEGS